MGHVPYWGKGLGTSGTPNTVSFCVTSGCLNLLFRVTHVCSLCLPVLWGPQFPHSGSAVHLTIFPFPLLKSLYSSVLSYFCPVILRVWSSGSSHLSLWDLLPLTGKGSPWRVTSEVGEALLTPCRPWPSGLPADQRFMRVIELKAHYMWWLEVWSSLYSHLRFLLPRGVPEVMGWSGRFLHTGVRVGERPTCGLQSHTGRTTVCFPGLTTLVGSGHSAPSFTDPFWKPAGWCLNRHLQGVGWNGSLSLSLSVSFFSLFCLSSLYLSLGPHPYNLVLFILKTLVYVFKFCRWYLCDAVLPVQLLLKVSADIVDTVEHLSLEIQTSPHSLRVEHWVTYWDFKEQKEKTIACISLSAFAM